MTITNDDLARSFANDLDDVPKSWEKRVAKVNEELRARWEIEGGNLNFEDWKAADFAKQRAETEERLAAEQLAEQRERNERNLLKQIPPRYLEAATAEPAILNWAREVRESDERGLSGSQGPSLLIVGPTGVGKTHAAFGGLRELVRLGGGRFIRVTTAADMYAQLRPRSGVDSEETFSRFASSPVLFVDDLGAAKTSEWLEEINYRLINHRYNHKLATLFTSNLAPRDLAAVLGDRVSSRLTEMCKTVALKGDDRRRKL